MSEDGKKSPVFSQILVAVVIALLAGGSAPWWWNEAKILFRPAHPVKPAVSVKGPEPAAEILKLALVDYEAVQALYLQARQSQSCVDYRRIVEHIRVYVGNKRPVPENFRYTVRYPTTKPMPTISDLATDRITRITQANSKCFN